MKPVITPPQWRDYFRPELKYYRFKHNVLYNTHLFHPFNFFVIVSLLCLPLGLIHPLFWAVAIANVVLLVWQYLKTRRLCSGLELARKIPTHAREGQQIEIHYTITNSSGFQLPPLSMQEAFDGVGPHHLTLKLPDGLKPHSRKRLIKKVQLDTGMGVKTLGFAEFILKDEFGLFEFKLRFEQEQQLTVYPLIELTPPLKAAVSPDTIEFGSYEISKRGDSNLFIGTREYRHGDPVRHINWKLSKKTGTIVVNEFEKNTNTFVTLLIDLEYGDQLGVGNQSTWETIKDLALSIAANEIRRHNSLQLLAGNLYLPFGHGPDQLENLERHFTFHELQDSDGSQVMGQLARLPRQSQLHFICPMITTQKLIDIFWQLIKLAQEGQSIAIFVVDPYQNLGQMIKGEMKLGIREMDRHTRSEFKLWQERFKQVGIEMVMIKVSREKSLEAQLREARFSLVELP